MPCKGGEIMPTIGIGVSDFKKLRTTTMQILTAKLVLVDMILCLNLKIKMVIVLLSSLKF